MKLRLLRLLVVVAFIAACLTIPKIDNTILFIAAAILATIATTAALIRLGTQRRVQR